MENKIKTMDDLIKLQETRSPNGTWIKISEDLFSQFRNEFNLFQKFGDEIIKSWSQENDIEVIVFSNNIIHFKDCI